MRPFVVLALNVAVGSIGVWVGGFAGGCMIAALVVADCMAVLAEGRAWAREDAADTVYDWSQDESALLGDCRRDERRRNAGGSILRLLSRRGARGYELLRRPVGLLAARADTPDDQARLRRDTSVSTEIDDWGREGRAG